MDARKLQKYQNYAAGFAQGQRDFLSGASLNACSLLWGDARRFGCELLPRDPRCRGWRKGWKFEARKQNGENWRLVLREKRERELRENRERELREAKMSRYYVPSLQRDLLQIYGSR